MECTGTVSTGARYCQRALCLQEMEKRVLRGGSGNNYRGSGCLFGGSFRIPPKSGTRPG